MRGVNGVVNGVNGHKSDTDSEDGDEDQEMGGMDSDLERELEAYVPESYRRAMGRENAQASSSLPSTTPATTIVDRDQARREQSDRASERMGSLMLQGYSLLSTLCPNPSCYAIPLVGHPRRRPAGGEPAATARGPRKECVVCGKLWEADGTVVRESVGQRTETSAPARTTEVTAPAVQATRANESAASSGPTIRDITREEAMRIYSGESPADVARSTITTAPAPLVGSSDTREQSQQTVPARPTSASNLDQATVLEHTHQALLKALERVNEKMRIIAEGPEGEFEEYTERGRILEHIRTQHGLMDGLERVYQTRAKML